MTTNGKWQAPAIERAEKDFEAYQRGERTVVNGTTVKVEKKSKNEEL